jgi:farnesyl diphosphate synthase
MDASPTRRGQPCWYKLPHVGMIAINDSFVLCSHVYKFLMRHFRGAPYYVQLLELFLETTWQTELGQQMDLTSQPAPGVAPVDLERFTAARYAGIVKHKTAYYSFYLPVACALLMAGVTDAAALKGAEEILVAMGEYFQIQDDVLDAFAEPAVLGKVGTDIQDNKCSWLVVQALARATPAQRELLERHYGRHAAEDVAAVKALYVDLRLQEAFDEYERDAHARITRLGAQASEATGVPTAVFADLMAKIFKREK